MTCVKKGFPSWEASIIDHITPACCFFSFRVLPRIARKSHEKRDDGCHSPAAVLQWIKGVQPEPELVYQALSALCETRRLNKEGYARFRNFLLYGERNLAGETVLVDIFQDVLILDYHQERLSRYCVLELWQPGEVEWFVIIRDSAPVRRRKRKSCIVVI